MKAALSREAAASCDAAAGEWETIVRKVRKDTVKTDSNKYTPSNSSLKKNNRNSNVKSRGKQNSAGGSFQAGTSTNKYNSDRKNTQVIVHTNTNNLEKGGADAVKVTASIQTLALSETEPHRPHVPAPRMSSEEFNTYYALCQQQNYVASSSASASSGSCRLYAKGFFNDSSSCFVNVVLQSLLACEDFVCILCRCIDHFESKCRDHLGSSSNSNTTTTTTTNSNTEKRALLDAMSFHKELGQYIDEAMEPYLQHWRDMLALVQCLRGKDLHTVYSSSSHDSGSTTSHGCSSSSSGGKNNNISSAGSRSNGSANGVGCGGSGSVLSKKLISMSSVHPDNFVGRMIRTFRMLTGSSLGSGSNVAFLPEVRSPPRIPAAAGISVSVSIGHGYSLPPLSKQEDAFEFLTFVLDVLHEELLIKQQSADRTTVGAKPLDIDVPLPQESFSVRPASCKRLNSSQPTAGDIASDDDMWCDALSCAPTPAPEAYHEAHTGDADDGDGWVEVKAQSRQSRVVVDKNSREAMERHMGSAATIVSKLFHSVLRSEVHYDSQSLISVTYQMSHCLTLSVDCSSVPTKHAVTPSASPMYLISAARGNNATKGKRDTNTDHPPAPPTTTDNSLHSSGSHAARNTSQECTLEEVLAAHFKEEVLSSAPSNRIAKRLSFDRAPAVLILQLNRLAYDYSRDTAVKLSRPVAYPAHLTIPREFLSEDLLCSRMKDGRSGGGGGRDVDETALQYELFSVVCHHGKQTNKGHYICFCKANYQDNGSKSNNNNESCDDAAASKDTASSGAGVHWRSFNDTEVVEVSESDVLNAKSVAYILFYKLLE